MKGQGHDPNTLRALYLENSQVFCLVRYNVFSVIMSRTVTVAREYIYYSEEFS